MHRACASALARLVAMHAVEPEAERSRDIGIVFGQGRGAACETQETPDLRSQPGDPPPQRKVNTESPEFKARYPVAMSMAFESWHQS